MTLGAILLTVSVGALQPARTGHPPPHGLRSDAVLRRDVSPKRQGPEGGQPVNAQAAALQAFQQRLNTYLELRMDLADRMEPLTPTANAAELARRQQALAQAIRAARKGAKQGDLVPELVASQITATILEDLKRRSAAAEKATFSEVPNAPRPVVNQTYPADAALPTVPPLLLKNLPPLPDNLQYRFYGRHLLLLDGDVQLIADFIANVLPPHTPERR